LNWTAIQWHLKPDFNPEHESESNIHNWIGRVVGILEIPPDANQTKWEKAFGRGGRYTLWSNFNTAVSVIDLSPDQDSARRVAIDRNGPHPKRWRGASCYLCRFDVSTAGKAVVEVPSDHGDHGICCDRAYGVGLMVSLIKNRNLILPFDMPEVFRKSLRKVHGEIGERNGVKRIEYSKQAGDDFALSLTYSVLAAVQHLRRF
jgi:hypothetical protein